MSSLPISRDVRQLVVLCPSWVGDVVMATPVLRAFRAELPQAHIIAAVRPGLDELLRGCDFLDEIITINSSGLLGPKRAAAAIARHKPQVGVLLPNSFRSGLTLRLSGVPVRIGFARDGRSWLLTHPIAPPSERPIAMCRYYAALAEQALGVQTIDQAMRLGVTDDQRLAGAKLLEGVTEPFVLLNPGANRQDKRWPAEHFAAVGEALAQRRGWSIVVNGSPREGDVVQAVLDALAAPAVSLRERGVTLGSLKAVMERAALLITNDTGPRHIAAALGTPTVCLFGPTDHRWTTLTGAAEHVLVAEPFLPELQIADDHPAETAIDRIRISDVLAAADTVSQQS